MNRKRRNLLIAAGVGLLVVVSATAGVAAMTGLPVRAILPMPPQSASFGTPSSSGSASLGSVTPSPADTMTVAVSTPTVAPAPATTVLPATKAATVAKTTVKPAAPRTTAPAAPKVTTAAPPTQAAGVTGVTFTCIAKANTLYASLSWYGPAVGTVTLPGGISWSSGAGSTHISGYGHQGVMTGTCTGTVGGITKTVTVV